MLKSSSSESLFPPLSLVVDLTPARPVAPKANVNSQIHSLISSLLF